MMLSASHILILLVVGLLFGHRRLPELASMLGKTARSFREGLSSLNGPGGLKEAEFRKISETTVHDDAKL